MVRKLKLLSESKVQSFSFGFYAVTRGRHFPAASAAAVRVRDGERRGAGAHRQHPPHESVRGHAGGRGQHGDGLSSGTKGPQRRGKRKSGGFN